MLSNQAVSEKRLQIYYKLLVAMQKKALTKSCPLCGGELEINYSIWIDCQKCQKTFDLATVIICQTKGQKKYC
jgi:hypothetical protein